MFNSRHANAAPNGKFIEIPKLMLGFDTETTGLWKPSPRCACAHHVKEFGGLPISLCPDSTPEDIANDQSFHEPVSYGFAEYQDGLPNGRDETYLTMPSRKAMQAMVSDPQQFAIKTHGLTEQKLRDSYDGQTIKVTSSEPHPNDPSRRVVTTSQYTPAIDRITGMQRAVERLADAQRRGATIVGANHVGFDLAMLKHHYELATGSSMASAGFDLDRASREGKLLDVIRHEWEMTGRPTGVDKNGRSTGRPAFRALSDSKLRQKDKDTLCDLYGVKQGDHTAAEDARASLDVAVKQILTNQGRFTRNPIRLK